MLSSDTTVGAAQKEATAMLKLHRISPLDGGSPSNKQEKSESTSNPYLKMYRTPAGLLFLRSCCSPSLVEKLQADEGLRAFARRPEREHQLLLSIAQNPDTRLT